MCLKFNFFAAPALLVYRSMKTRGDHQYLEMLFRNQTSMNQELLTAGKNIWNLKGSTFQAFEYFYLCLHCLFVQLYLELIFLFSKLLPKIQFWGQGNVHHLQECSLKVSNQTEWSDQDWTWGLWSPSHPQQFQDSVHWLLVVGKCVFKNRE